MGRPKILDEFASIACRFARSRARHRARRLEQWREYYRQNSEAEKSRVALYQKTNPEKCYQWKKNAIARSPQERIRRRLRSRLHHALDSQGAEKTLKTLDLLGCSASALVSHLENLFLPGMSWENFGAWHIDHRTPCASFDLSKLQQQKECFHFSNLRPLWAKDNLSKGSKIQEVSLGLTRH